MNTNIVPAQTDHDDCVGDPADTGLVDLWAATAAHPSDAAPVANADHTIVMTTAASLEAADDEIEPADEPADWRARMAAGLAAVMLVAAIVAFVASRTGGSSDVAAAADHPAPVATTTPSDGGLPPAVAVPEVDGAPGGDTPSVVDIPVVDPPVVAEVPDPATDGGSEPPSVPGLDVQEPPPAVAPPMPPAPEPPAPAPVLGGQLEYELDPGVDNLTVTLTNEGDAPLAFSIDVTDDFSVDASTGEIPAGGNHDLWVELSVEAVGDGPTLFDVPIAVTSDGGDATIEISGQVEKPGYLVADFADLPLVDHRGVVSFTNVGELPIEIIGFDAPGITTAPIPDQVAAGTTWELEIAICADTTIEPELLWSLDGTVGHRYASSVTVETATSESTTTVSSFAADVPLPSCEAVIDPIDVVVIEVDLP